MLASTVQTLLAFLESEQFQIENQAQLSVGRIELPSEVAGRCLLAREQDATAGEWDAVVCVSDQFPIQRSQHYAPAKSGRSRSDLPVYDYTGLLVGEPTARYFHFQSIDGGLISRFHHFLASVNRSGQSPSGVIDMSMPLMATPRTYPPEGFAGFMLRWIGPLPRLELDLDHHILPFDGGTLQFDISFHSHFSPRLLRYLTCWNGEKRLASTVVRKGKFFGLHVAVPVVEGRRMGKLAIRFPIAAGGFPEALRENARLLCIGLLSVEYSRRPYATPESEEKPKRLFDVAQFRDSFLREWSQNKKFGPIIAQSDPQTEQRGQRKRAYFVNAFCGDLFIGQGAVSQTEAGGIFAMLKVLDLQSGDIIADAENGYRLFVNVSPSGEYSTRCYDLAGEYRMGAPAGIITSDVVEGLRRVASGIAG